jgi:hypothetical protein
VIMLRRVSVLKRSGVICPRCQPIGAALRCFSTATAC